MSLYRENAQPLLDDVFYGPHILDWLCDENGCHCCIVARMSDGRELFDYLKGRMPARFTKVAVDTAWESKWMLGASVAPHG